MMGSKLIGRYFEESDRSYEFLNTGHTEEIFQEAGKHFSERQRLNSFASIGAISGAVFFRKMAGISSGPVALVVERSFYM